MKAKAAALHALRVIRAVRHDAVRPPYTAPGHYYSPQTSPEDIERAVTTRQSPAGVDLRVADQLALAAELDLSPPDEGRWVDGNGMFDAADAAMLRAMMLRNRPRRMVEIGSGYSTALALDVAGSSLPELHITCVEPYPDRLRSRLRPGDDQRITLIERPVQDLAPEALAPGLAPGDIFFIDSTHVAKAGSDVLWLFLRTLPLIPPGVLVHVHDIQWPFEYPDEWLRERRDWTETYLLHAFLIANSQWRIELWGDWLLTEHPEVVPSFERCAGRVDLAAPRVTSCSMALIRHDQAVMSSDAGKDCAATGPSDVLPP